MPRAATLKAALVSTGATAAAAVRTVFVIPAVAVRSSASTTAIMYDLRVGTSICDTLMRNKNSATASSPLGASGTRINTTLDGRWVNTIVFNSPKRFASGAVARNDSPATTLTQKNTTASTSGEKPQRRWNQYATSECTTRPPANASSPNSADNLATVPRERCTPRKRCGPSTFANSTLSDSRVNSTTFARPMAAYSSRNGLKASAPVSPKLANTPTAPTASAPSAP